MTPRQSASDVTWRTKHAARLSQLTVPDLYELLSTYCILFPGESAQRNEEAKQMVVTELITRLKRDGTRERSILAPVFADAAAFVRALLEAADMGAAFTEANTCMAILTLSLADGRCLIITVKPTPAERRLGADERWRLTCGEQRRWDAADGHVRSDLTPDMEVSISDTCIPYMAEFVGGEVYFISARVVREDQGPALVDSGVGASEQQVSTATATAASADAPADVSPDVVIDPYAQRLVADRLQAWLDGLDRPALLAVAAVRSAMYLPGLVQHRGFPF